LQTRNPEAGTFADRAAFKQGKTHFIFESVDLSAQSRLRDVQLRRSARDVFCFSHGDKITEMGEFHFYLSFFKASGPRGVNKTS
jgi:hypothetical protein